MEGIAEMHTLQPGNNPAFFLSIRLRYSKVDDKIKKMKLNLLLNICYYQTYIHIQCVLSRAALPVLIWHAENIFRVCGVMS